MGFFDSSAAHGIPSPATPRQQPANMTSAGGSSEDGVAAPQLPESGAIRFKQSPAALPSSRLPTKAVPDQVISLDTSDEDDEGLPSAQPTVENAAAANAEESTPLHSSVSPQESISLPSPNPTDDLIFIGGELAQGICTATGAYLAEEEVLLGCQAEKRVSGATADPIFEHRIIRKDGREIGKMKKDVASFLHNPRFKEICHVSCKLLSSGKQTRVGLGMHIQMLFYLKPSVFIPYLPDEAGSDEDEEEEDEEGDPDEEKMLGKRKRKKKSHNQKRKRQKQKALSKDQEEQLKVLEEVFDFVKLKPSFERPKKVDGTVDKTADGSLKTNELLQLYQEVEKISRNLNEAEPGRGMKYTLRPYQKQALWWMSNRESRRHQVQEAEINGVGGIGASKQHSMDPTWIEYTLPMRNPSTIPGELPARARKFYMNKCTGDLTWEFPGAERGSRGGILADEMGLGKTIEVLALIHTNQPKNDRPGGKPFQPATLVVCPMSLLAQWKQECLAGSIRNSVITRTYYGSGRRDTVMHCSVSNELDDSDSEVEELSIKSSVDSRRKIVFTTYGTLRSEYEQWKRLASRTRRRTRSNLFAFRWQRVVLDEAHQIKNHESKTSIACSQLQAVTRWAVTGTPIQNTTKDIYSLVRFLHYKPWSNLKFWNECVSAQGVGVRVVRNIMSALMLRRVKTMRDHTGKSLIDLPRKHVMVQYVKPSQEEAELYKLVRSFIDAEFRRLETGGQVSKSYAAVFEMLMRLRQMCCHPVIAITAILSKKEGEKPTFEPDNERTNELSKTIAKNQEFIGQIRSKIEDYKKKGPDNVATDPGTQPSANIYFAITKASGQTSGDLPANATDTLWDVPTLRGIPERCPFCQAIIQAGFLFPCYHRLCKSCFSRRMGQLRYETLLRVQQCEHRNATINARLQALGPRMDARAAAETATMSRELQTNRNWIQQAVARVSSQLPPTQQRNIACFQCNALCPREGMVVEILLREKGDVIVVDSDPEEPEPGKVEAEVVSLSNDSSSDEGSSNGDGSLEATDTVDKGDSPKEREHGGKTLNEIHPRLQSLPETVGQSDEMVTDLSDGEDKMAVDQGTAPTRSRGTSVPPSDAVVTPPEIKTARDLFLDGLRVEVASQPKDPEPVPEVEEEKSPGHERHFLHLVSQKARRPHKLSFPSSSKIRAITNTLKMILRHQPSAKIVIFSMFTSFLDVLMAHISYHPDTEHLDFVRMDGSLDQARRETVLRRFKRDAHTQLLYATTKTGGVGLNLVAANYCLLTDPWWNHAVEQQAIDRVHRIGQKKEVVVVRFFTQETVETAMLEIQDAKMDIIRQAGAEGSTQELLQGGSQRLGLKELRMLIGSPTGGPSEVPTTQAPGMQFLNSQEMVPLANGDMMPLSEFRQRQAYQHGFQQGQSGMVSSGVGPSFAGQESLQRGPDAHQVGFEGHNRAFGMGGTSLGGSLYSMELDGVGGNARGASSATRIGSGLQRGYRSVGPEASMHVPPAVTAGIPPAMEKDMGRQQPPSVPTGKDEVIVLEDEDPNDGNSGQGDEAAFQLSDHEAEDLRERRRGSLGGHGTSQVTGPVGPRPVEDASLPVPGAPLRRFPHVPIRHKYVATSGLP